MTYLELNAINSNPIFAPLGEEATYKRRIFLENFKRCMTIRTFQKTAGIEIKKAVTGIHPTAKIMKPLIKKWEEQNLLSFRGYNITFLQYMKWYVRSFWNERKIKERIINQYQETLTSKSGRWVNTRIERFNDVLDLHYMFDKRVKSKMYKLGFYNFIDLFLPWIKNPNSKKGASLTADVYSHFFENGYVINNDNQMTWLKSKISFYGRD
jgi:hypothetical protein